MIKPLNPVFQKPRTIETEQDLAGWIEERVEGFIGNSARLHEVADTLLLLEGDDLMQYVKQQMGADTKVMHFARELQAHQRRLKAAAEEREAERLRKQKPLKSSDPNVELYIKPVLEDETGGKKGKKTKKKPTDVVNATPSSSNVTVLIKPGKKGGRQGKEGLRLPCDCQAQEHALVTNCIECGKIICEQEGPGPCLFCGSDVGGQQYVQQEKLADDTQRENFFKALAQRNRLVEYERNSAKRTMVYDDQADYFTTSNTWLSEEEKEFAAKKEAEKRAKEANKRAVRIAFDFAGRRVITDESRDDEPNDAECFAMFQAAKESHISAPDVEPLVLLPPPSHGPSSTGGHKPGAYAAALKSTPATAAPVPAGAKGEPKKSAEHRRLQYDYYQEEETSPAEESPSPFKMCGVIDTLKSSQSWPLPQRKRLVDLLHRKRMTTYVYAPKPETPAEWREMLAPAQMKLIQELHAHCAEKKVTLNYGLHIGGSFATALAFAKDSHLVANRLTALAKLGLCHFSILFDTTEALDAPISEGGKNLGVLHAEAVSAVMDAVARSGSGAGAHFYLGPAYRHGDLGQEKSLPKKNLYYWRDLNANLHKDAILYFHGPEVMAEKITSHFASDAWSYFGKARKIVLWDSYPANDFAPQAVFLHPYEGRDLGLENYFHGVLSSLMLQPECTLVTLATIFDFLHAPIKYVPLASIKEALAAPCLNAERTISDLLNLIALSPSPIAAADISETANRLHKFPAPGVLAEMETSIANAKAASYAPRFKEELAPFFAMCELIVALTRHKHDLKLLLREEEKVGDAKHHAEAHASVKTKIETEQGEILHIQRQLDALLGRK